MANPKHIEWLLEGVEAWNERRTLQDFDPDFAEVNLRQIFKEAGKLSRAGRLPLKQVKLQGAHLKGSDLRDADLRGASLWASDLRSTNLRGASLFKAILSAADLSGADLRRVDLAEAVLFGSSLRHADLRGAKVDFTALPDARHYVHMMDVRGTDLSRAKYLNKRSYMYMRGDRTTILPLRLETPPVWLDDSDAQFDSFQFPELPQPSIAHKIEEHGPRVFLSQPVIELEEAALEGLFEDLLDAIQDLRDFGNLDNQAPLLSKGVERFLKRLPEQLVQLDQIRFGTGVQALNLQFASERNIIEEVAPEKVGHLEAVLMRANLIAANLPIWQDFKKDEQDSEPIFAARQEEVETILEHAADALENDPEHFDPSLFKRIREYLDDATMISYLASKDLLVAIAGRTFALAKELSLEITGEQRKQAIKSIATALNVQLGAILADLAGILPKQLGWLVDWLKYLPTLLA